MALIDYLLLALLKIPFYIQQSLQKHRRHLLRNRNITNMCIKEHTYFVCNCQNVACPAKYLMCCPYGPQPNILSTESGHIISSCESREYPCSTQTVHLPEPCKKAGTKLRRVNIGLCSHCQATCGSRQTGCLTQSDMDTLSNRRKIEMRMREHQEWEWRREVDSD